MQLNTARRIPTVTTAGGSKAYQHLKPMQALRRSVLACMLWEDEFYEDGQTIADRIGTLIADAAGKGSIHADDINKLAIEARSEHNLRHVPLLICAELAKVGGLQASTLTNVIQRADEISEFLTIYWRDGKTPIAKQVKKGLAGAFHKFGEYALAKYDREKAIRLRDVMFLVHPKPKDEAQADLWKRLVDGKLAAPDTWEVALSSGADKKATWERMLSENTLGYLALLRNLRNMTDVGVDESLIKQALLARKGAERVLPFRYVAAARACPRLEPTIDQALSEAISALPILPGRTVVLVDVSGSMGHQLSGKSDMTRMDAAAALASLINGEVRMFSFSDRLVEVPPRRGMAGVDALMKSQLHSGTQMFDAIRKVNSSVPYDRLIVITDEQDTSHSRTPCHDPIGKGYMVNVASNKNGVGYGKWTHLDGFSEGILKWIPEMEKEISREG